MWSRGLGAGPRSGGGAFQGRGGPWHRGLGPGDVGAGEEQRRPAGLDWSGVRPWGSVWSDHEGQTTGRHQCWPR